MAETMATPSEPEKTEDTKMLGAHVEESLYWEFKKAAAARGEQLKDAVRHAARMYIGAVPKTKGG